MRNSHTPENKPAPFIELDTITRRFTSVPPFSERLAKRITGQKANTIIVHAVEGVSLAVAKGEKIGRASCRERVYHPV